MPLPALSDSDISRLGLEVPLSRVDKALKELWEQDSAKTRASLINFAIYTEDPARLAESMELLEVITAEHACRALLILNIPAAEEPRARAYINALCRPYQGRQVVCSEQVAFILEGGGSDMVQNIVFAHLDSDLPLVVWWQGTLTRHFDERLYSRIDTLIVDSSRWANPAAELGALTRALECDTADFDVRDLSWTRSHYMRMALAGCLQDALALERLPGVNAIEVRHAPGHAMSALLLGGWVAMRLGGVASEGRQFIKADGSKLELSIHEAADGPPIQSLGLSGGELRVLITREAESRFVHLCASCPGHEHEEVYPADVVSEADLVGEQLSRAGGRTLYGKMIPLINSLV
jgi:glucose-6-phosphate dehydrogenase assembly protein OpcA